MIKYVISDDINCKKLLPFKRAHVPVIDSEVVIEYIITVFILSFIIPIFVLFSADYVSLFFFQIPFASPLFACIPFFILLCNMVVC